MAVIRSSDRAIGRLAGAIHESGDAAHEDSLVKSAKVARVGRSLEMSSSPQATMIPAYRAGEPRRSPVTARLATRRSVVRLPMDQSARLILPACSRPEWSARRDATRPDLPAGSRRRSARDDGLVQPQDFGFDEPPPRPTTPPVRRGFLVVLFVLCLAALVVYGVPYVAERIGYAWEAGRARADSEALAKLDKEGIVNRASVLFRMATNAVSPAVVNVQSFRMRRGGEGFPGMPVGGNRLTPGLRGARAGLGRDHRQGERLHRHEQPRRQGRRSRSWCGSARATTCRPDWSVPTPSPIWPSSRSRRT